MDTGTQDIASIIRAALAEDIGDGDVTTDSIFGPSDRVRGRFIAKTPGIVAGLTVAAMVFEQCDTSCIFAAQVDDGSKIGPGTVIASIDGPARGVLSAERTALNVLQRMSGIATRTRSFVNAVEGTGCTILDTRKTAPGLRVLDKMAVRIGGGRNHRRGLYDMVLIKDNHIDTAGSMTRAVGLVRSGPHASLPVEVECRTLADVDEAVGLSVDRIMLDNMDPDMIRKAVARSNRSVPLEVSGNVSLDSVRLYAEMGVQYVSVGALTHSVTALDISLSLDRPTDTA